MIAFRAMRILLFTALLLCVTTAASQSDTGRLKWTAICDTAGTEIEFERCVCARLDSLDQQMHIAYNAVLVELNKRAASLRADSPAGSYALTDVEEFTDEIRSTQNAWLEYRKGAAGIWHTLGPRHTGSFCIAYGSLTLDRKIELQNILNELTDQY